LLLGAVACIELPLPIPDKPELDIEESSDRFELPFDLPEPELDSTELDLPELDDDESDDSSPPIDPDARVRFLGGTLEVFFDPFSWRIRAESGSVRSTPHSPYFASAFNVALAPAPRAPFYDPTPRISPRSWRVINHIQNGPEASLVLVLESEDAALKLRVDFEDADAGLRITLRPEGAQDQVAHIEFAWEDQGGPLYGAGLGLDALNKRGVLTPLFHDHGPRESGSNDANVVVPFIFNPQGYAVFVEGERPGVFDLGVNENALRARFDSTELSLLIWLDASLELQLQRLAEYHGSQPPLPRWALAPMLARPLAESQEELFAAIEAWRAAQLPLGAVLLADTWQGAYNDLQPNAVLFPDPAALLAESKRLGVELLLSANPYLDLSDDSALGPGFGSAQTLYDEALAAGALLMRNDEQPLLVEWAPDRLGALSDFGVESTRQRWASRASELLGLGFGGARFERGLDFRLGQASPRFFDGSRLPEQHLSYGHAMPELFAAAAAQHRPDALLLMRRGALGSVASVGAVLLPPLHADSSGSSVERIGGLRSAVIGMLSLSCSGFGVNAAILGGELDSSSDPRQMVRWAMLGALSPLMILRMGGWEQPRQGDGLWQALQWRMRLLPYIEQQLSFSSTRPLLQPLGVLSPYDTRIWERDDGFGLGTELVVFPALDGVSVRRVRLPVGLWYEWNAGQSYTGSYDFGLSQSDGPLIFMRAGAVVPVGLEGVESLAAWAEPSVIRPEDLAHSRHYRVAGPASQMIETEDGARIELQYDQEQRVSTLRLERGERLTTLYVEHLGLSARSVVCDGEEVGADEGLALVASSEALPPAYRVLPWASVLRLGTDSVCELHWR
jgi:alpha-glucosidase (family GH31 glycosyl hydrolase)